jgi:hypothetical protein
MRRFGWWPRRDEEESPMYDGLSKLLEWLFSIEWCMLKTADYWKKLFCSKTNA